MGCLAAGVCREIVTWLQKEYDIQEFLETGTFHGDSTAFAASIFDFVISIELDENNWRAASARFASTNTDVQLWQGDSAELIYGALRQLDTRALIWLDAHNVAGQFGDEDACPVIEELIAIVHDRRPHIILIDDAHCFMPPLPMHLTPEAWPTLDDITVQARKGGYQVHITHDVIVLAPPAEMAALKAFIDTLPVGKRAIMRKIKCNAEAVNGPMKKGAVPTVFPGFTGLTYTNYGWMLVHRFDANQTPSLLQAGISRDHPEIERLGEYLQRIGYGAVFVDVGANMGAYSFALRRFCAEVHAFEPQRIIYNMLAGSVAINGWLNVYTYNVALGHTNGIVEIPHYDYNKVLSFGSIEFGGEQKERLAQERKINLRPDYVPLARLDDYSFKRVDVLKIDVEGMEESVLAGAWQTIERCRPIILIEHLKSDKEVLRNTLEASNYVVQDFGPIDYICFPVA